MSTVRTPLQGVGSRDRLNVSFNDQHYDVILSMLSVTEHPYNSDYCDVGDKCIEDNGTIRPHRCSFCLADTSCIPDGTSIQCIQCHGCFKNVECYQNHLKPYSIQT
jgi:hypothetical protein